MSNIAYKRNHLGMFRSHSEVPYKQKHINIIKMESENVEWAICLCMSLHAGVQNNLKCKFVASPFPFAFRSNENDLHFVIIALNDHITLWQIVLHLWKTVHFSIV